MNEFTHFYLDKEKDIIVVLYRVGETMEYTLRTPNHTTGNLIRNLAKLCELKLGRDETGLFVIRGTVPSYYDAYHRLIYIFRLGNTKVANIYPDGTVEMKAAIPAISKTLMSQTKHYNLSIAQTIVKTYIRSEVKFRSDLHTHMNANLSPDLLIALGISHQIRYPLYYIKKLNLRLTHRQMNELVKRRRKVEQEFSDSTLSGKYRERTIDDHTFINFASLILGNLKDSEYNLAKIRASLAVMKDGQAVFSNLEKVYLYRYVFTRGIASSRKISLKGYDRIPDANIVNALTMMIEDHASEAYKQNTLFQDKLLWIARSYARLEISYAEISDTSIVK